MSKTKPNTVSENDNQDKRPPIADREPQDGCFYPVTFVTVDDLDNYGFDTSKID